MNQEEEEEEGPKSLPAHPQAGGHGCEGAIRTQRCTSSTLARLAGDLFVALDFESAALSTGDLVYTWTATQERPPTLTAFLFQLSSPLRRHWHTRVRVLFRQLAPTMQSTSSFAHLSLPPLSPHAFLAASDDFLLLFDRLGHGVFSFIQADIRGNIAGLRARVHDHHDPTLEAILTTSDDHAIGCLVRLIRGYRYVHCALSMMLAHPELALQVCFKRAYDQVLRPFHPVWVRSLVAVAIRASPSRQDFCLRIAHGMDLAQFDTALAHWLAGLDNLVTYISPLLPYH
ncbi:hypothetical protein Ac2012v2_002896 [Leucoagaricus gongylophorus]